MKGKVVWFDSKKGFGFISRYDGSGDVFVHYSNVNSDGFKTLKADQEVEFEYGSNHKGTQAVNVKVLSK